VQQQVQTSDRAAVGMIDKEAAAELLDC